MIQHIKNHKEHCGGMLRTVDIKKNSRLDLSLSLKESNLKVRCYHHQVIDHKGINIEPISFDSDGSIHGIELNEPGRWVVGVQWHPERSKDEKNRSIIKEFVKQAEVYKMKKIVVEVIVWTAWRFSERKTLRKRFS